jgi:hypothetical protein
MNRSRVFESLPQRFVDSSKRAPWAGGREDTSARQNLDGRPAYDRKVLLRIY